MVSGDKEASKMTKNDKIKAELQGNHNRRIKSSDKDSRKICRVMKGLSKEWNSKGLNKRKNEVLGFGDRIKNRKNASSTSKSKKKKKKSNIDFREILEPKPNFAHKSPRYLARIERNPSQNSYRKRDSLSRGSKNKRKDILAEIQKRTSQKKAKNKQLGKATVLSEKLSRKLVRASSKQSNYTSSSKQEDTVDEKSKDKPLAIEKTEQEKTNEEFLNHVKLNEIEKCLDLISPERELKADLNATFDNDWTPLHFSCWKKYFKIVNLLVFNGANVNCIARNSLSPLMVACSSGCDKIAKVLINAGAEPNGKDGGGNSPIHYAAKSGSVPLIKLLLEITNVNLKTKNNIGMTPIDLAPNKEAKKYLLKNQEHKEKRERETMIRIHKYRSENFAMLRGERKLEISHHDSSSTSRSDCNSESANSETEKLGPHHFMVHSLIGRGAFGEVYLVERKDTGEFFAMKVLDKDKILKHNLINYAKTERNVLSIMNHPFIVRLVNAFQTGQKLFLILEYCPGGDLAQLIRKKTRFDEKTAKLYLCEIILALQSLHDRDIIFRDLKPDNIVIDAEGHVQLTDFGLSKEGVLQSAKGAGSFCGSVAYLAPEMLRKKGHGKAVDWYLLGVLFYEMLVGVPPYFANTQEEIFTNIEKAPLKIPSHLTKEAKLLLRQLLQRNPAKRLGSGKLDAEEIKSHDFFSDVDWHKILNREICPPKPEIKLQIPEFVSAQMFYESGTGHSGPKVEGWSFINDNPIPEKI